MPMTPHLILGTGGHLVKNAAGHLVNDCGTPWDNPCNDCEPPLADRYLVKFNGLAGLLEYFNEAISGPHLVEWAGNYEEPCKWLKLLEGPNCILGSVRMEWWNHPTTPGWYAWASCGVACLKTWKWGISPASYNLCLPVRPVIYNGPLYDEWYCGSQGCPWGFPDPCPPSQGATCEVAEYEG